jgi:SMI1 / KNR4 family (SUKH-1)
MPFPLDPARVDAAESALGYRLPAAYRRSMIRANGGAVLAIDEQWWLHPIFDDSDKSRLKRSCNDIIHETSEARAWRGFPEAGLAIAANPSGDALVLLPGEGTRAYADTVYCFLHETGTLQPVADSFDLLAWSAG